MKYKLLIVLLVGLSTGCAKIHVSKVHPDGTKEDANLSHLFSKGSIQNFRGGYVTKTTSGLVSFSNSETETQKIEDFGAAFGAAAASAMKKSAGVP